MTDLRKLQPLPLAEWDASLAPVINDMSGRPLNVHGLMAHHPALLSAWWSYRMHGVNAGELSDRHRELAVLRVAVHLRCWYEWASHVERGGLAGLTEDEIAAVQAPLDDFGWSVPDALLLRAVDECVLDHRIHSDTLEAIQENLSVQQTLDIFAIAGMYVTLGTMLNTWNPDLDDAVKRPPRPAFDKTGRKAK